MYIEIEPRQCAIKGTNPKIQPQKDQRLYHPERVLPNPTPRLDEEGFRERMPPTPEDGNCFPHAIIDQIRYVKYLGGNLETPVKSYFHII